MLDLRRRFPPETGDTALRLQVWLLDRGLSPSFDLLRAANIQSVTALCLLSTDEINAIKGECLCGLGYTQHCM